MNNQVRHHLPRNAGPDDAPDPATATILIFAALGTSTALIVPDVSRALEPFVFLIIAAFCAALWVAKFGRPHPRHSLPGGHTVVAEDVKDLDVWLDRLFRNGADVSISLQEPNPSFLAEGLLHRLVDATDGWVRPRALTIRLLVRDDVPDELTMVEKELSAIRSYYAEDELRIEIRRNELVSPEEIYILGDLITFSGPVFNPGSPAPTLYGHLPDSPSAGKRASAREAADTFESAWSAALPVA